MKLIGPVSFTLLAVMSAVVITITCIWLESEEGEVSIPVLAGSPHGPSSEPVDNKHPYETLLVVGSSVPNASPGTIIPSDNLLLTTTVNGIGSIDPGGGTYEYSESTEVTVAVVSENDWQFDGWTGDVTDLDFPSTTITKNTDKAVSADFSEIAVPLDKMVTTYVVPAISDDRILPDTSIPASYISDEINLTACPGEYEPASFVIRAHKDISVLQLEVTDLTSGDQTISSDSIDIRVVKPWYQAGVSKYDEGTKILTPELLLKDDTLVKVENENNYVRIHDHYLLASQMNGVIDGIPWCPSIEEFPIQDAPLLQPITINANENKQIWITVKVPNNAVQGIYKCGIDITVGENIVERMWLELEVLPINLIEPCLTYSLYYHSRLDPNGQGTIDNRVKSKTQLRTEMENLVSYGITNPVVYQDWKNPLLFQEYLEVMKEVGMATSPLFLYGEGSNLGYGTTTDPTELDSLQNEVAEVIALAESSGFSDVYFYGIDEALAKYGIQTLVQQANVWQAIHSAGGKVFVAGIPAGFHNDDRIIGDFGFVGPVLDLFNSNGTLLSDEAKRWHSEGHKVFSYSNPQLGLEKPETYRRNFGLLLWQADYDGAMDFAYQAGVRGNIWNDWRPDERRNRAMAYPTIDGVIDTVQWEGWREGVDDVRYLSTLLKKVDEVKAQGKDTSNAERFIHELKCSNLENTSLDNIREEIIGQILALMPEGTSIDYVSPSVSSVSSSPLSRTASGECKTSINWQSSERAHGYIEYGNTETLGQNTASTGAFMINHTNELSGLDPNTAYYYRVICEDTSGNVGRSDIKRLGTFTSIDISSSESSNEVAILVESSFDKNAFIDFDRSLIGWWRFDGEDDFADYSSYSKNGINHGTSFDLSGKVGGARVFGGTDSCVLLDSPSTLWPTNAITVEAWIYPTSVDGIHTIIAMQLKSNVNKGVALRLKDDRLQFLMGNGEKLVNLVSPSLFEEDEWYHIAGRWDGMSMTLWINGKQTKLTANLEGLLQYESTRNSMIGAWDSAGYEFDGLIDDVRIWNRALTLAEMRMPNYSHNPYELTIEYANISPGIHEYQAHAIDMTGNAINTERIMFDVEEGHGIVFNFSTKTSISN